MFDFFEPIAPAGANTISPITLAFVGDAVYSLYVRAKLALAADRPASALQKLSCERVSAHGQNGLLKKLEPILTPEELAVFKRGRNAKKPSHSKNADPAEYNNSTGLEAVFGWLYLSGQRERLFRLLEETE